MAAVGVGTDGGTRACEPGGAEGDGPPTRGLGGVGWEGGRGRRELDKQP
jgi:hypothetical protein